MAITPTYSPYLDTNPNGVPGGFSQEYGYFEMNAKLTGVSGFSDAFWLMPNSGPWPPEIDIEEHPGSNHNEADFTNHGGDINTPVNNYNIYNGPDFSAGFHTYGLMWTPTTITWYFDGTQIYSCPTAGNEQQPMNIILSAYANKGLGYVPDVQPGTSDNMQVNWVHVYSNDGANPEIAGQAGYLDHDGSTSLTATPTPIPIPIPIPTPTPTPTPIPTPTPTPVTVGSGPDNVVLKISESAYVNNDSTSDAAGDARFEMFVDGKQQGGVFNAAASHKAGADQLYTIKGSFGAGPHTVAVQFLNDAWNPGSPDAQGSVDRNLYVDGASYDGTDAHQTASMMRSSTSSLAIPASATPTTMTVMDDKSVTASVPVITSGTASFKGALDTTVSQSVANGTDTVSFDAHVLYETVMLGSGTQSFVFHAPVALNLTGGSGTDTVVADFGAAPQRLHRRHRLARRARRQRRLHLLLPRQQRRDEDRGLQLQRRRQPGRRQGPAGRLQMRQRRPRRLPAHLRHRRQHRPRRPRRRHREQHRLGLNRAVLAPSFRPWWRRSSRPERRAAPRTLVGCGGALDHGTEALPHPTIPAYELELLQRPTVRGRCVDRMPGSIVGISTSRRLVASFMIRSRVKVPWHCVSSCRNASVTV